MANTTHVCANWVKTAEDIWTFNSWSNVGTNPVIFKTADPDLNEEQVWIVFEFVLFIRYVL